jgi:hypothetical protein
MSRPTSSAQAGLGLLIALALLAIALLSAPRPAPGGAFGQPAPAVTTGHSVFVPEP